MSQDSLQELIDIFASSTSQDSNISNPANEAISEKICNDGGSLIIDSSKILMNESREDEKIKKAQTVASSILSQMLNISNVNDLEFNRQNLSPEIVEAVKNSLKANIFSDDTTIRDNCCKIYSFLIATLTTNWQDGINYIINSFSNTDLLPNGFINLFLILRNIVNQINFTNEIIEPFNQQFIQTLSISLTIISKEPTEEKYTSTLRSSCINYMSDLIKISPKVIKISEDDTTSNITIPSILNSLSNSFQIYDVDLYTSIQLLLLNLIQNFYRQSPSFMEQIVNYMDSGIDLATTHPKCSMVSINFWQKVAIIENKIIDVSVINEKLNKNSIVEPLSPLLCETVSDHLIPKLIQIIENVDETDTEVEDFKTRPMPSMYANRAISAIYKIIPEEVFNIVTKKIEEALEHKEKWSNLFIAISLIYTICENPTNEVVADFINNIFDILIESSMPNQVPKLRETAIFVLSVSIKNYNTIISHANSDEKLNSIVDVVSKQISSIDEKEKEHLSSNNSHILISCTILLYNLSNVWKDNVYESRISAYFDQIYNISSQLFEIGIQNENELLIKNSAESLNNLIYSSTPDISNKLKEVYEETLKNIDSSNDLKCSQDLRNFIVSRLLSHLSTLLLKMRKSAKYNQNVIEEHAPKTLEVLYNLLGTKDINIYEEGLMAMSALINATCSNSFYVELFTQETFNRLITEFIYNGLTSMNVSVTNATCLLIGNLYYFLSSKMPDLIQAIPDIFDVLSSILLENKDLKASYPFVLKALADVFNYSDFSKGQKPELEPQLADLLKKLMDLSTSLDITNDEDLSFGNMFYTYLCQTFTGYARVYYDREDLQKERDQLFMLDKLSNYIWKLSPKIDADLIKSFVKTAKQFAENCSRRNNVILNRHSVHRVLKFGFENSRNQDMKREIKNTIDYLKSR